MDDNPLVAEKLQELRSFFMRAKESEKLGLKLNFNKTNKQTKIMVSIPETSWQIEQDSSDRFYFLRV